MFILFILILLIFLKNEIKCFLFSVIIPIYNTERYLDESIGSIINQTIGIKNIQLILVNDGSTDNCEKKCLEYQDLYQENIIYIKIKNGGVSNARNEGLKYAKGLYINFLDSDDKWDLNAFKYIHLFFEYHKNVDIVAGRIKYFELNNRYPSNDYKFKISRVTNLTIDYKYIQYNAASCFFRRSSIIGKKFDKNVIYAEDVKFLNSLLLEKPLICFLKEATYNYRKRADSSSAWQNIEEKIDFYFNTIYFVLYYLIEKSLKFYKKIQPFIQYYIATEILSRLEAKSYKYLDLNSFNEYSKLIQNLLQQIDDKYILDVKIFHPYLGIFALSRKYKIDKRYSMTLKNNSILYSHYEIINLINNKNIIIWKILEVTKNILHLEGEDIFWMPREKYYYFCKFNNKIYFPKYYDYSNYFLVTMYGTIFKGRVISFDIPIEIPNYNIKDNFLHFYISYMNNNFELFQSINKITHIPPIQNSYYISENIIIKNQENKLAIYPYNDILSRTMEEQYLLELKKLQKYDIIKLRTKYMISRANINSNNENQIWLINDRKKLAGDNGEYFFKYLNKIKPKGINFYFVIDNNCSDYERLKNNDNIIDINSQKYIYLFLNANKIITSIDEPWVKNPFGEDEKYVRDLFQFKIIYLKNGIIKDDLSMFMNKILKNYNLLISSSKKEYESLLNINYGYSEDNIILAGMPRFDNFKKLEKLIKKEKLILIFPTWRKYIKGTFDLQSYESIKSDNFINTDYFKFYNSLINDQQLLSEMDNYNYTGILCLHPNFAEQYLYFQENKIFKIKRQCFNQELLIRASLLITDYSSIFFDFGYIKRSIIYTHFDIDKYRKNHFPKGYFSYENDGFGPICHDMKCTIAYILDGIHNECKPKYFYLRRINKYFHHFDELNCYRIFEFIKFGKSKNKFLFHFFQSLYIFIFILIILKKLNLELYL